MENVAEMIEQRGPRPPLLRVPGPVLLHAVPVRLLPHDPPGPARLLGRPRPRRRVWRRGLRARLSPGPRGGRHGGRVCWPRCFSPSRRWRWRPPTRSARTSCSRRSRSRVLIALVRVGRSSAGRRPVGPRPRPGRGSEVHGGVPRAVVPLPAARRPRARGRCAGSWSRGRARSPSSSWSALTPSCTWPTSWPA